MLGTTYRRFLWCWLLLLFYLTGDFSFIVFWRYPSSFRELLLGFYNNFVISAQPTLSFELFWAFPSQFYREWYGFERKFFTHKRFLPCTPSPHFGTFLWLRCGQGHPIQDPSLCLPSQGCPFRLTHGLELLIL